MFANHSEDFAGRKRGKSFFVGNMHIHDFGSRRNGYTGFQIRIHCVENSFSLKPGTLLLQILNKNYFKLTTRILVAASEYGSFQRK